MCSRDITLIIFNHAFIFISDTVVENIAFLFERDGVARQAPQFPQVTSPPPPPPLAALARHQFRRCSGVAAALLPVF